MLEIRSTEREIKNAFHGLISRLDKAKKRINKLEDMSIETFQTEREEFKKKKGGKNANQKRTSKNCEII